MKLTIRPSLRIDSLRRAYVSAKAGRNLTDIPEPELSRIMALHSQYVSCKDVRVSGLRGDAIQKAVDACVEEYEAEAGEIVKINPSYIEGSPSALIDLLAAAVEMAEDSFWARTDDRSEFAERILSTHQTYLQQIHRALVEQFTDLPWGDDVEIVTVA